MLSPRRNRLTAVVRPDQPGAPIVLVSVEGDDGVDADDEQQPRAADDANAAAASAAAAQSFALRRASTSACAALSLGVLGSTVFPIPFAVSRTGLLSAALTMAAVAWANDQTSSWLIQAAAATGHSSYEALALWAGGRKFKRLTQLSLIALLWGTMVAGLCLIADTGRMALRHCLFQQGGGGGAAGVAAALASSSGGGRLVMLAVSALVLFPLCLQRRMRELEAAGAAGGVLVLGLVALLFWRAGRSAWRGLADVPVWSLAPGDPEKLPEAFAIYFTAFYMQPMLLPLVRDMPGVEGGGVGGEAGEEAEEERAADGDGGNSTRTTTKRAPPPPAITAAQGLSALRTAVRVTLYAVACGVYLGVGVAGAGAFGKETHGNVLTNDVLDEGWGGGDGAASARAAAATARAMGLVGGGPISPHHHHRPDDLPSPPPQPSPSSHPKRAAAAVLYALVLLYLALGMTTTQFALRSSLDIALFGAAGDDVGADAPATPTTRRRRGSSGDEDDDNDDDEEEQQQQQQLSDDDDNASSSSSPTTRPLRPGFTWARHVLLTAGSIASAAFVACLVPRAAEKVYAVVGATGVCAVSYVIPAVLKVQLYREKKGLGVDRGRDEGRHRHQHDRRVVARRAPRPGSGVAGVGGNSALALPLLLDHQGDGDADAGTSAPGGYIFGAAAGGAGAAAGADDELGLASALLTPPLPPPPQPQPQSSSPPQPARVAVVVRRPASAHQHQKRRRRNRWRLWASLDAEAAREVLLPIAVALFGVLSSAAALAVAVKTAFFDNADGDGGGGDANGSAAALLLGRWVEAYVL
jgi:amino acid permease